MTSKINVQISYDMQTGKEQECQDYLAKKLAPGLARMGFQFSDVSFTIWGNAPHIMGGGVLDSSEEARDIFLSSKWEQLLEGMEPLAENFQLRLYREN